MTSNDTLFTLPDAEWHSGTESYLVAYEAESFGEHWNGWATPVVSRRVMEAFVARMQFAAAADGAADLMTWDGNGVRVLPFDAASGDDADVTWLLPDTDGNFDLGVLGYTFQRVEPNARVLQTVES